MSILRPGSASIAVLATFCLLLPIAGADRAAAQTTTPPRSLVPAMAREWKATVVHGPCTRPPSSLPRQSCRKVRIEGPGLPPLDVEVRVFEPHPTVALRGTVLFGSGGWGNFYFGEPPGGDDLFRALTALGYRVVDRAWASNWWGSPGVGVRLQAGRYATLLRWVLEDVHTTGAFSAVGLSCGAGEIAYALSTYGFADVLDVAVLASGPPMTRLDYICQNPPPVSWASLCPSLAPAGVMSCGALLCTFGANEGGMLCAAGTTNPTSEQLHVDSILHPNARIDYATTRVHVVIGGADCTNSVSSGLLFHSLVASEKVLEFAPGTSHRIQETAAGQAAIGRALLGVPVTWSGPATLAAPSLPRLGQPFSLHVHGLPGEAYHVFLGGTPALAEFGAFGWWFLGSPYVALGGGQLDGQGRGVLTFPMPSGPGLVGTTFYDQALTGGRRLTNLVQVVVLP